MSPFSIFIYRELKKEKNKYIYKNMPKTGTKSSVHCSFRYIVLKLPFVPKRGGDKISILPIHRAFRGDKIGDKILTGICTLFFPIHRTKTSICSENAQNPSFLPPLFFPIHRAFKGDKKGDKMGTNWLIFVPFCPLLSPNFSDDFLYWLYSICYLMKYLIIIWSDTLLSDI